MVLLISFFNLSQVYMIHGWLAFSEVLAVFWYNLSSAAYLSKPLKTSLSASSKNNDGVERYNTEFGFKKVVYL